MTRIFDNIADHLGTHLSKTLQQSAYIDASVGYFNLRGWEFFAGTIDSLEKPSGRPLARILVGMTTADPGRDVLGHLQGQVDGEEGDGVVDNSLALDRYHLALRRFNEQLSRGVPNQKDLETLRSLKSQIESGQVQLRLFTRRPLHGKTYLCYRPEDLNNKTVGFVGSSNLTLSGLQSNFELNVDVLDDQGTERLSTWFEDRWTDKFSLDVGADVVKIIERSWAGTDNPTPHDVYMKVCWHLSRDVREGLVEFSLPAALQEQLLEYQERAVKALTRRVETRRGSMLGDVVGLGKTITAIAVAALMREEFGYEPLIVCPANLQRMWLSYLDTYEIPGRVVPYSQVTNVLPDLERRHRLVIVDEAHTLRSDTRQDYKALKAYIDRCDSRVLLLTATPFNTRFLDVANQIGLYIDDDDDLGLQPQAAMALDPRLVDKVDGKVTTLGAFRRSEESEDWKRLMSDHLIRRTRSFIRSNYAETVGGQQVLRFSNGESFVFPERLARPLTHSFGPGDPAALMASDRTLDVIDALVLPRYDLGRYVSEAYKPIGAEKGLVDSWRRSRGHLRGFMRTGLYKRLSSCGFSFELSLRRHVLRNELWLYALSNGKSVPVGAITDRQMIDAEVSSSENDGDLEFEGEDSDEGLDAPWKNYETLVKRNPRNIVWVDPELFTAQLIEDLALDARALQALLRYYGPWNLADDSKTRALAELLLGEHKDDKVLIFTEYKDTAVYVKNTLNVLGVDSCEVVTGQTADPTALAARFAPTANRFVRGAVEGGDLRVLVSTDVLSEGQNLQDAHVVVNYDLPWAIVRLIQRAGRIDRIGQTAEAVLVYSFFHEDVENVLGLRQRIRDRLEQNAEVFGSDEKFFGTESETKTIEGLYNGELIEEEDSENDASSLAYELWSNFKQSDPEGAIRVQALPDMVYATRSVRAEEARSVAVYVRTERDVDAFGYAGEDGSLRLLTGQEALRYFACPVQAPSVQRGDWQFVNVVRVVRGPLRRTEPIEGRLRGTRARVWKRLSGNFATLHDDVATALDALYRRPLTADAERRIRAVLVHSDSERLDELISALHTDGKLVVSDRLGFDPIRIVCSMGAN